MKSTVRIEGLTQQDAAARQAAGQGNTTEVKTGRTYQEIFRDNVFTFINGVYFFLSLILIVLGRPSDVFVMAIVVLLNVVVNVFQEMRAKKKLDKISLLTRPKTTVVREGQEQIIDPSQIVLGDVVMVRPGDQIVVDGSILQSSQMKMDESLLTGESDLILKQAHDPVYSGSFCVSGSGYFEVEKVGRDSLANQMTAAARSFRRSITPLQHEINLVIRILLAVAILLGLFVLFRTLIGLLTFPSAVEQIAVITGLVPSGLYLMVTLGYALGSVRIADKNALIQQANAVESISNVDVMCLDKTGTLTTNQICLESITPLGLDVAEVQPILGAYAASVSASNRTNDAILQKFREVANKPIQTADAPSVRLEIPFSSAYKWSAIGFRDRPGIYVMGAPEILATTMSFSNTLNTEILALTDRGLRVLLFAFSSAETIAKTDTGEPILPADLKPIGLLQFSDVLRPDAKETLSKFLQAGIGIKIISGDNPDTVAALAKQAGMPKEIQAVSGQALAQMDEAQFTQTAKDTTVFGRVTPEQKARLVKSLQSLGYYVAMMGDGVNDVLSLKQANVGVAMESGSQATRGVADIVLLKDSFSALPDAFLEGQRIRNGINDITKLFLVRVFSFVLVILAVGMITFTFPTTIKLSTIVLLLGVGIPTYSITLWAKPGAIRRGNILPQMLDFLVPATLVITLASLGVYLGFLVAYAIPVLSLLQGTTTLSEVITVARSGDLRFVLTVAQSALISMQVLGALLLIPFLKPPTPTWVGVEPLSRDWRYTILALLMFGVYLLILAVPGLRSFFGLLPLSLNEYLIIGLVALLSCLVLRYVWRHQILNRFLGVPLR